jgi:hypothetical protein
MAVHQRVPIAVHGADAPLDIRAEQQHGAHALEHAVVVAQRRNLREVGLGLDVKLLPLGSGVAGVPSWL